MAGRENKRGRTSDRLGEELLPLRSHPPLQEDDARAEKRANEKPRIVKRWLGKKPHRFGKTGFADI